MNDIKTVLDFMRAQKASQPSPAQILEAPPWTREQLEQAHFTDFQETSDHIDTHPGFEVYQHLGCLTQSFALFDRAVADLFAAISRFQHLHGEKGVPEKRHGILLNEVKLDLEKNLFTAAQAALALVDHSRRISKKIIVPGYEEKTESFANDPGHQFMQGLRACIFHVFYISPNWEVKYDLGEEKGKKTRFLIKKKQLLLFSDWSRLAREFIDGIDESLDLETFLRDYREKVRAFQSWFVANIRLQCSEILADYLEARRILRALSSRSWWNLILSQVLIQNNRDPYEYLDRFFDSDELTRIYTFRLRTKEQVDCIISMLDEHGACDDKLRQLAYRAFKVGEYDRK